MRAGMELKSGLGAGACLGSSAHGVMQSPAQPLGGCRLHSTPRASPPAPYQQELTSPYTSSCKSKPAYLLLLIMDMGTGCLPFFYRCCYYASFSPHSFPHAFPFAD